MILDPVEVLAELVAIPSVNPDGASGRRSTLLRGPVD